MRSTLPIGRLFVASVAALLTAASLPGTSRAAVQVEASVEFEQAARVGRADVEVWTNKEEGGVYRQGEPMRVFFRTSADAFVLIYNIDTEGYIHLVYPYGPDDPDRVEGGVTHQVPSRNDPYEMVADGPTGIEYVVAIASPFPFRDLPWYLTGGTEAIRSEYDDDDGEDSGVIVGDPYVGMDRVVRRVVPPGSEDDVATDDTFFYIERKVEYPRYVCADCHSYGGWYDPYGDICSVVDVRIDATWARFRPLRSRVIRPRYFYMVRSTAPNRYRQWKERWSSVDGRTTLRTRFQVDGQDKFRSRRDAAQRRTPQEFRDIRRPRAGRTWSTPDQVLRRRAREEVRTRDQSAVERDRARRERDRTDRSAPQRQRDMQNRDDGRARRDDARRDEARQRDETRRREVQERGQRRQDEERQIRERRQYEERQIRERERRPDVRERRQEERRPDARERRQEERRPDARERRQEERRPDVRERRQERRPDPPQARERREERPRSETRETPKPPKSDDPPPPEDRGSRGRGNDERRQDDGDRGRGRGQDRGR